MWWPLLFKDKTIPELLKKRGNGRKTPIILWLPPLLATVGMCLLVFLVISLSIGAQKATALEGQSPAVDANRKRLLDDFYKQADAVRFRNLPIAAEQELNQSIISNKVVFIADVPRGPNRTSTIEGRRFIDCAILGPVVITGGPSVEFGFCTFIQHGGGIESMLVEIPSPKIGMIEVNSSAFMRCAFYNVALAGRKNSLDIFRANTTGRKQP
jgi:hypothetical protein